MATISKVKEHDLGEEEAMKRASEIVQDIAERLKATVSWSGNRASFKGTGFSGSAVVTADRVAIDVDLGLMLRPLKGTIEEKLENTMNRRFS